MSSRDLVRFLPNERVDVGDALALQYNVRSDQRSAWATLLFGTETTPAALQAVIGGFVVTEDGGGPSSIIEITNGAAICGELLTDGTGIREYGVLFGREVQTVQQLDFAAESLDTYNVYVRFVLTAGKVGTRVFTTGPGTEGTSAIETRFVVDWDVTFGTSSPGDEWIKISEVVWNGVTISTVPDITDTRDLLFEGNPSASYAHTWGDGGNDRNVDRATYGVFGLRQWFAAVRRQFADIIGVTAGGAGWFTAPPISLKETLDHTNLGTDPHGATLVQSVLQPAKMLQAAGNNPTKLAASNGTDGQLALIQIGAAAIRTGFQSGHPLQLGSPDILIDEYPAASGLYPVVGNSDPNVLGSSGICLIDLPIYGAVADALAGAPNGELSDIVIYGQSERAPAGVDRDIQVTVSVLQISTTSSPAAGTQTEIATSGTVLDTASVTGTWSYTIPAAGVTLDTAKYRYVLQVHWNLSAAVDAKIGLYNVNVYYKRNRLF